MSDKPKPCPFCGRKADIYQIQKDQRINPILWNKWVVGCGDSLCAGYIDNCSPFYTEKETALKYWNRRGGRWEN